MESVRLNNGVDLPLAGLGTWDLRGARCVEAVRAALDLGCRLSDTAQMYDNEALLGGEEVTAVLSLTAGGTP